MTRSVDMFEEAFLPSLLGFAAVGLGFWIHSTIAESEANLSERSVGCEYMFRFACQLHPQTQQGDG
jgi:hypothetical protein